MTFTAAAQYAAFIAIVTAMVRPLGGYLERVFSGTATAIDPIARPLERFIFRMARVDPDTEMTAAGYSLSFVLFGFAGTLLLYVFLRVQTVLPWFFPEFHTTPLSPDLSFNTALSFTTTTTWQAYAGERTMSYVSQMAGLCAQNFLAAAATFGLLLVGSLLVMTAISYLPALALGPVLEHLTPLAMLD